MSTLTSTSTDAQVGAAYDDNASYAEDNSVSKCRAFITACRFLLRRRPAGYTAPDGRAMSFDYRAIAEEKKAAEEWIETHSTDEQDAGPRVTRTHFNDFRS